MQCVRHFLIALRVSAVCLPSLLSRIDGWGDCLVVQTPAPNRPPFLFLLGLQDSEQE